jgi:hypothetical protein
MSGQAGTPGGAEVAWAKVLEKLAAVAAGRD